MHKLLTAFLVLTVQLDAWGPVGHSLVARIAESQLTPAARARVAQILGPDRTMSSVASWADEVRSVRSQTSPWHFVDIPIIHRHLDMARDCPKNDCILVKLPELRKALVDPSTAEHERAEALMFLIHFIGDMHQPLHCADNNDHGGNQVSVSLAGGTTNLHSLWDGAMLGRIGTEEQLFPEMAKESAKHAKKWRKGAFEDWAEESHEAARKKVYGKLSSASNNNPRLIDAAYEKMASPVIRELIEKAGARLALILNETAD